MDSRKSGELEYVLEDAEVVNFLVGQVKHEVTSMYKIEGVEPILKEAAEKIAVIIEKSGCTYAASTLVEMESSGIIRDYSILISVLSKEFEWKLMGEMVRKRMEDSKNDGS